MGIIQHVRSLVSNEHENRRGQSRETSRLETTLYRCEACDVTYISERMTSCPRCDGTVETTPSERTLERVSAARD